MIVRVEMKRNVLTYESLEYKRIIPYTDRLGAANPEMIVKRLVVNSSGR